MEVGDTEDFETVDDLVAYLIRGGRCEEADARHLIAGIMAADVWGGRAVTPEFCWGTIVDLGFLDRDARAGWVTREGKMLSAAWGAHEKFLDFMGLEVPEVERAGWARVTPHNWQCGFRLSRAQKRRVEESGFLVDDREERTKPHWTNPAESKPPGPSR